MATSDELLKRADEIATRVGTHWDGCWQQHDGCLAVRLAARVRKLQAERDALRADAERLDWLDANWHSAFVAKSDRGYLPWASNVDYQPTLRAAIDAALAGSTHE